MPDFSLDRWTAAELFLVPGDVYGHWRGWGDLPESPSPCGSGRVSLSTGLTHLHRLYLEKWGEDEGRAFLGSAAESHRQTLHCLSAVQLGLSLWSSWGTRGLTAARGWSGMSCMATRPKPGYPPGAQGLSQLLLGTVQGMVPLISPLLSGRRRGSPPVRAAAEHLVGKLSTCLAGPRGRLTKSGR